MDNARVACLSATIVANMQVTAANDWPAEFLQED